MTNDATGSARLRIRPWWGKLAYFVVAALLVYLAPILPVGQGGAGILRSALAFVLVILGARLFRGIDEDVPPARPWWRMTAGVPSGILLGSVCTVIALFSAVGYVGIVESTLPHKDTIDLPALLVNAVLAAVLAYLYFASSRRTVLARREAAIEATKEPAR